MIKREAVFTIGHPHNMVDDSASGLTSRPPTAKRAGRSGKIPLLHWSGAHRLLICIISWDDKMPENHVKMNRFDGHARWLNVKLLALHQNSAKC
jgi:hypothetical protein